MGVEVAIKLGLLCGVAEDRGEIDDVLCAST
jgi:hypothetical protein